MDFIRVFFVALGIAWIGVGVVVLPFVATYCLVEIYKMLHDTIYADGRILRTYEEGFKDGQYYKEFGVPFPGGGDGDTYKE